MILDDLDGLEDNIDRYQTYFDQHDIGLRPHIKTHKCLAVAHMQMARGAIGTRTQDERDAVAGANYDNAIQNGFCMRSSHA